MRRFSMPFPHMVGSYWNNDKKMSHWSINMTSEKLANDGKTVHNPPESPVARGRRDPQRLFSGPCFVRMGMKL